MEQGVAVKGHPFCMPKYLERSKHKHEYKESKIFIRGIDCCGNYFYSICACVGFYKSNGRVERICTHHWNFTHFIWNF